MNSTEFDLMRLNDFSQTNSLRLVDLFNVYYRYFLSFLRSFVLNFYCIFRFGGCCFESMRTRARSCSYGRVPEHGLQTFAFVCFSLSWYACFPP